VRVVSGEIINTAATITIGGDAYVFLHGHESAPGAACPAGQSGDLVALRITAGMPPGISTVWCTDNMGQGSPIVTTTDGQKGALVWTAGAEGSNALHAWDALTGAPVFSGGTASDTVQSLRHFTTLIAVHGRIFAGADDRLFAWTR
jgi:hypothetical protein